MNTPIKPPLAPAEERLGQERPRATPTMRLVLDTSAFVNPDTQQLLGSDADEALAQFFLLARKNDVELYMPASVFRELSHFVRPDTAIEIRREVIVRGPDLYRLQIPAAVLHVFVGDLRERINKGLRIAERAILIENTADNVRRIRNQYREALRSGIVDSVEDLDVALLAMEVRAAVLCADQGIASFAEALGLEVFPDAEFLRP